MKTVFAFALILCAGCGGNASLEKRVEALERKVETLFNQNVELATNAQKTAEAFRDHTALLQKIVNYMEGLKK